MTQYIDEAADLHYRFKDDEAYAEFDRRVKEATSEFIGQENTEKNRSAIETKIREVTESCIREGLLVKVQEWGGAIPNRERGVILGPPVAVAEPYKVIRFMVECPHCGSEVDVDNDLVNLLPGGKQRCEECYEEFEVRFSEEDEGLLEKGDLCIHDDEEEDS